MAKTPSSPLPSDPQQVRMTFGEHLDELRKRIVRALLGSIGAIAVCIYFSNDIVEYLLNPYRLALRAHHYPGVFANDKPHEVVISYITIGFQAGLILSSPWIIYQIWLFVGSGLFPKERRIVYRYIGPSVALFLTGILFFYFLVLPATLNFFVGFTDKTATSQPQANWIQKQMGLDPTKGLDLTKLPTGDEAGIVPIPVVRSDPSKTAANVGLLYFDATEGSLKFRTGDDILTLMVVQSSSLFANTPRFDDYIKFVTWTAITMGLAFEMPMVILVLVQIGLVQIATFRSKRKYAYFALFIVAVIIAPTPDWLIPLFFFIPLLVLYESGILAAAILLRKRAKQNP